MTTTKPAGHRGLLRGGIVFGAIALIPLIYAGVLISSNEDPTHRLDSVPAAIVNDDAPATSATGDTIDLGASLSEELVDSSSETNFSWKEMDDETAAAQLADGSVLAVLSIPTDFSADAASIGGDDPSTAVTAKLGIETNDGANLIVGSIATTIGNAVAETVSQQVSESYLDSIYLGFTEVHDSLGEAADGAASVRDGAASARDGSGELLVGLSELRGGAVSLASGAAGLRDGANTAASGATSLSDGLAALAARTSALPGQGNSLIAGAKSVASGADTVASGAASALSGAQQLAQGEATLAANTPTLATGAGGVTAGLQDLIDNYATLSDSQRQAALNRLLAASTQVSTGATETDQAVGTLTTASNALVGDASAGTGLAALNSGASSLATGAGSLATGVSTLGAGLGPLSSAIATASAGASGLADGTSQLADGATALSSGASALASGSSTAESGASTLNSGLGELADGSGELADSLAGGVDDVPSYTDGEASALSTVAAAPIELDASRANEVQSYGYGLAPYFMALSLWVGALAFYLMAAPLRERLVNSSRAAWLVALRSYLPGAGIAVAQGLFMALIVRFGIGIEPANMAGIVGLAILTSLTFVAINQALISLLGAPGRFVALLLMVLQLSAAGGTYPIQTAPAFFQAIHGWLPLTYVVEAFRSLIAGGGIGITQAVLVLGAWLIAALGVTVAAVVIARRKGHEANVDVGDYGDAVAA